MDRDKIGARDQADAVVVRGAMADDRIEPSGRYTVWCVSPDGREKWRDTINNVICTEGKNLNLDTLLAGSAYTVVGPYMGLISNVSWSAVSAGDTGAQINGTNGWKEAGGTNAPGYTGNRKTCVWSAAAAGTKALSAALSYAISSGSNVIIKGFFIVLGTGAVNTKDDAHGTLWSAGTFTGGDKTVSSGDTVNVSYSTTLT